MPVEILGPMVVIGIALAWFLVRLLVNAPAALIRSNEAANRRFAEDFPLDTIEGNWLISDDQKVAIAPFGDGNTVALVLAFGSKQLTRKLISSDIGGFEVSDGHVLIKLKDFTLPEIHVEIASGEKREQLTDLLDKLVQPNQAETGAVERATLT